MSAFDPERTLDLGPTRFSRVLFGELSEFPSLEELFPGKQGETLRCIELLIVHLQHGKAMERGVV